MSRYSEHLPHELLAVKAAAAAVVAKQRVQMYL
jgi:hypothetical protein